MSTTLVPAPSSIVRLGHAQGEVTPPVGIYHRMWGAAKHDKATGVHRPIKADAILLEAADGSDRFLRLQLDLVLLSNEQADEVVSELANIAQVPRERILVTHSHTHSAGYFVPNRISLPGGDLIEPYLASLKEALEELTRQAVVTLGEVSITYAHGRCNLAAHRDYRDSERDIYATGYNPDEAADDLVIVARVNAAAQGSDDSPCLTIVHYACHPTTLAWDNTLLSPDFAGAMREVVQGQTGAPCVFFQRPCGDLGPRDGFSGDTSLADRNGRQLGFAALSALSSMGPSRCDFTYGGPVESGATIGTWAWTSFDDERRTAASRWAGDIYSVDLTYRPLPDEVSLRTDLERFEDGHERALTEGNQIAARDLRAMAERCRRWLGRLEELPEGDAFPYHFSVFQLGDAVWVTCSAEPYNVLARELSRRFPDLTILISPLDGDSQIAYLLPRDKYGIGLYQEDPSCLGPGCLEAVTDAMTERIEEVTGRIRVA